MEGPEVAWPENRATTPAANVPVVVMTAAGDATSWAARLGAVGALQKPFDIVQLIDLVEMALQTAGLTGSHGLPADPALSWPCIEEELMDDMKHAAGPEGTARERRGRGDIHIHTSFSDGLATPEQIVRFVETSGLDLIAIADHDTIAGALAVREIVARGHYPFEVIVGTEVTTARGVHLLALFVEEPLPQFRSLEATIEQVERLGGLCIAPHPLSPLTPSLGRGQIERLLAARYPLAGVETLNPSPAGRITRAKLQRLNAALAACRGGRQ